ncbi:MAG TPA: tRNA-guanine transglycosylase [Symbiobacteriaceae bacterium]|nr:tRNA-guanine transglycosylase [Symbiobacteriaceae bacterium]
MGSTNLFTVCSRDRHARTGLLKVPRHGQQLPAVVTPILFPVVNLMTGTTPRGGGIWKYVLRSLFQQHSPMMTQALQFLDFSLTGPQLQRWVNNPQGSVLDTYMRHYGDEHPDLGIAHFLGPVFLDSGGFKFLGNNRLDLTKYGVPSGKIAWEGIMAIQDGIGGDIYVSLDYPLKPGLVDEEAVELIDLSLANAWAALGRLSARPGPRAPFFAPCHGRTYDEMRTTVMRFFEGAASAGLGTTGLGIGIGSLVPLRTVRKFDAMLGIIEGARDGIPATLREAVPLHVFGVTGNMIPILAYLGVDTFDSSSYIQNARTLEYYHPERHVRVPFMEMEANELPCICPHCLKWQSYGQMHAIMMGSDSSGAVRSEVYAALALHNLYWDNQLVAETQAAIKSGAMLDFLVDFGKVVPTIRPALDILAKSSSMLDVLLSRQYYAMGLRKRLGDELTLPDGPIDLISYNPGPPPWVAAPVGRPAAPNTTEERRISLKYTPDSFVVPPGWMPNREKDILLVLPCSDVKPYRLSRSQQSVMTYLGERLASVSRIQKITLSGLYGPVPLEFEHEEAVMCYDFRLTPADEAQTQLCVMRLVDFLRKHESHFALMVGYVTSRAYREVMTRAALQVPQFQVLPGSLVKQAMTELYRREHLDGLASLIEAEVRELDRHITGSITA